MIRTSLQGYELLTYRKHGFLNTRFSVKSTFEYGLFRFPGLSRAQRASPRLW